MRQIALVLLATACLCGWPMLHGSAMPQTSQEAAVFSATPLKSTYTQGEAVQLQLTLRNTSRQTLVVDGNLAMGNSVHPGVVDPQGKEIDWGASFVSRQADFQTLAPGASLTTIVCLNCGIRNPFHDPFRKTGEYAVHLEYSSSSAAAQTGNFPNAAPLEQTLAAKSFHFRISPASIVFSAQPEQSVFHVGEPVTFNFQLQNRTKQAVLTAYDLSLGNAVQIKVIDGNGKQVPWTGQRLAQASMLSTVSAGHSIDSSYPITPTNLFGTVVAGCDIHKPGTYTAYAVYMVPESFNVLQAYVGVLPILIVPGPIFAPPVKFTVKAAGKASSSAE